MGWFDDLGGFVSDTVGGLFEGGEGDEGGFLEDLFTPKNILDGIGIFGGISAKSDAEKQASENLDRKYQQDLQLNNIQHQQAMELLKLKAALGGGGGGGSGGGNAAAALAYQKKKDRYEGRLNTGQVGLQSSQAASNAVVQALNNLLGGAQRPLIR